MLIKKPFKKGAGLVIAPYYKVLSGSTLKTGLVSFWEMETTSWLDATASGNDLTGSGSPTTTTGLVGNAASLVSASSQFLSRTSNAGLQTGGQDWSIMCWFKGMTFVDLAEILSKYAGFGNREFALSVHFTSGNRFQITIVTNSGGTTSSLVADAYGNLSTGTWYFVVVRYTNSTNTVTITVGDGAGTALATNSLVVTNPPIASSTAKFCVGANDNAAGNGFVNGAVDQVGLWKKVLSAGEMTQLYNAGAGLAYSGM